MPVKKKRKSSGVAAAVAEDGGLKKCKISSYCRSQPSARLISGEEHFSSKKCLAWFYEYAGPDEVVGPEGMEKFCEDIGVEPENIIMLVLAWKLEAESMGFFTKEEWLKGMTSLQCDCTEKLQNKFDFLRSQLNDISSFKNIYRYAFDFARDKDQRSLDIDTAKSMLALLLGRTWPLFSVFYQYLEQSKYRVMNKDQWYNVLEFSRTVHADLSNYDEDGACPVTGTVYKSLTWLPLQQAYILLGEGLFFLMNSLSGKRSVKHHSKNYCEENANLLVPTCIQADEMRGKTIQREHFFSYERLLIVLFFPFFLKEVFLLHVMGLEPHLF